ncbi:MAG: arsenate reductase family protein [Ignavibacterium sp.]
MNIQIFGRKDCNETRKAERFFSDRRIAYHFRDLKEKGISPGELENITHQIPIENLIDTNGKRFKERNLIYIKYNITDVLLDDPLLFKTPIVRNGKLTTIGYVPDVWKKWIDEEKNQ